MARKITEQPITPTGRDINDTNTLIKHIAYTQKEKKSINYICLQSRKDVISPSQLPDKGEFMEIDEAEKLVCFLFKNSRDNRKRYLSYDI